MPRQRIELLVTLLAGIGFILLIVYAVRSYMGPVWHMKNTAKSMIGRPINDLVIALGEPKHVVHAGDLKGRTVDYPWKGMNFVPIPTRPVRNRVLLYSKINYAIYVYVDEQNRVEVVLEAAT
jgi:hypothetical protein